MLGAVVLPHAARGGGSRLRRLHPLGGASACSPCSSSNGSSPSTTTSRPTTRTTLPDHRHEHRPRPRPLGRRDRPGAPAGRGGRKGTALHWGAAAFGLAVHSLAGGVALASAVAADVGGRAGPAAWGVFLATLVHKPADALTIVSLMLRGGRPADAGPCGQPRLRADDPRWASSCSVVGLGWLGPRPRPP